jgi:serine O-acetyltransferase
MLYHDVTLGGSGKEKGKRHPTIGNRVLIGAGSQIIGSITIGDNSLIGANTVVLKEVPPNSTVVGSVGRVVKLNGRRVARADHGEGNDPLIDICRHLQRQIDELKEELHRERLKNGGTIKHDTQSV